MLYNTSFLLAQAEGAAPAPTPVPVPAPAPTPVPTPTPIDGATTTATETVPTTPAGEKEQAKPEGLAAIFGNPMVMLVLFIVIFYFLLIRPQSKAKKEHQQRLSTLERGDKIITNAGIHGTVENVSDTTVKVKVAEGVILTLEKQAVAYTDKKNK